MRDQFCETLVSISDEPSFCFLTGDLGFAALEPLAERMAERFINAGVSEQNMLTVAAALAKQDMECWAYSIAPFCYARGFEQIRNDIAFHNLPVRIVGNGGGYAYGVMGSTHHAIEDYGILGTLPNIRSYVPVFKRDIPDIIKQIKKYPGPTYLRLGKDQAPKDFNIPLYNPWRQLIKGKGPVVVVIGPIASIYIDSFNQMNEDIRPNMWVLSELPVVDSSFPKQLIKQIKESNNLLIIEEHIANGGAGHQIVFAITEKHRIFPRIFHSCATSQIFDKYGSQEYLRRKSGLDVDSINKVLQNISK